MNFMYVYVLCHKEGHNYGNLFNKKYNMIFKYVFNHWVGMFHGVLPGTFTYSHIANHHKYDNDHRDVYSTAYRPRDEIKAWVRYLPEWFGYASNVSSIWAFYKEGRDGSKKGYELARGCTLSTLWYIVFASAVGYIHPTFCLATIVYSFIEGNILLSVVNWAWHAMIDPDDPSNDYVNSMTVIEGLNFTLGEEYHVVYGARFPTEIHTRGCHWMMIPRLLASSEPACDQ
jgi:hypothetical protein